MYAVPVQASRALLATVLLVATLALAPGIASGQDCTITGTSASELLPGTNGDDVICAEAGNDTSDGQAGDDVIKGQRGRDTLTGFGDDDILIGGRNRDRLDTVDGVSGNDTARGGRGSDVCRIDDGDATESCETVVVVPV